MPAPTPGRRSRPHLRLLLPLLLLIGLVGSVGVVGAQSGDAPSVYVPVTPHRVLDTRTGLGGHLGPLGEHLLTLGDVWVPDIATAVVLNVTVTGATEASYLTVQPASDSEHYVSSINYAAGETVANLVVVKMGSGGQVWLKNALGSVDVIADLSGYYVPGTGAVGDVGPQGPVGPKGDPGVAGPDNGFDELFTAATFRLTELGCAAGSYQLVVARQWGEPVDWLVEPGLNCRVPTPSMLGTMRTSMRVEVGGDQLGSTFIRPAVETYESQSSAAPPSCSANFVSTPAPGLQVACMWWASPEAIIQLAASEAEFAPVVVMRLPA